MISCLFGAVCQSSLLAMVVLLLCNSRVGFTSGPGSPVDGPIQAFQWNNGLLSTAPTSQSAATYAFPGGMLAISANGTTNGILWAVQRINATTAGVLHAYKATDLGVELYNSNQAGSRDTLDIAAKFNIPLVANGKVYVASVSQLTVYGQ